MLPNIPEVTISRIPAPYPSDHNRCRVGSWSPAVVYVAMSRIMLRRLACEASEA